jgi:hypothetical protein
VLPQNFQPENIYLPHLDEIDNNPAIATQLAEKKLIEAAGKEKNISDLNAA